MTKKVSKKPEPKVKVESKRKFNAMDHWKGMPEFTQTALKPVKQLLVNFETNSDMLKFSKLIGQEITAKTRSIWYPKVEGEPAKTFNKRWVDKK